MPAPSDGCRVSTGMDMSDDEPLPDDEVWQRPAALLDVLQVVVVAGDVGVHPCERPGGRGPRGGGTCTPPHQHTQCVCMPSCEHKHTPPRQHKHTPPRQHKHTPPHPHKLLLLHSRLTRGAARRTRCAGRGRRTAFVEHRQQLVDQHVGRAVAAEREDRPVRRHHAPHPPPPAAAAAAAATGRPQRAAQPVEQLGADGWALVRDRRHLR